MAANGMTANLARAFNVEAQFDADYEIGKELGQGAFATVYECTNKSGEMFAAKVIDKAAAGDEGVFGTFSEADVLCRVQHPNIMRLHDFRDNANDLIMIVTLLKGGELFDKIVDLERYTEETAARLMYNLLQTLDYLHQNKISHRDLKPENLVLKEREAKGARPDAGADNERVQFLLSNVSLVDFGFACDCEPGQDTLTKICGTPDYMAPEILQVLYKQRKGYSEKSDIWSAGVIGYILVSGYPPFSNDDEDKLFRTIMHGRYQFHKNTAWDKISEQAKDFVKQLLTVDPAKRPSAAEAMRHPWLSEASPVPLPEVQEGVANILAKKRLKTGMRAVRLMTYLQACRMNNVKPNSALTQGMKSVDGVLDLRGNYLGTKGLKAAVDAVVKEEAVHTLILKGCELTSDACEMLCTSLQEAAGMTALDVSDNPSLTEIGGRALYKLTEHNTDIIKLELTGTKIMDTTIRKIARQLLENRQAATESDGGGAAGKKKKKKAPKKKKRPT